MQAPLLNAFLLILRAWAPAFAQSRSTERAIEQALGSLLALGRRTLSRSLWALGRQHQDWSADYKLHSRSHWKPQDLFQPILEQASRLCDDSLLVVAMDDTRIRKTGRKILSASYQRDPLSPKFRYNLMWGLRFLHFSLLVPLYRNDEVPARALPVRFLEVPALKKPGRKASSDEIEAYQDAVKEHNLSRRTIDLLKELRESVDTAGLNTRTILAVGDASFCNRTLLRQPLDRIEILSRTRRDCRLCHRTAEPGGRRFYSSESFTPDQIRQDESRPWQQARIFHGGQWRDVRYKEVSSVYWRSGGAKRPLRLIVVAPIPYDSGKGQRKYYRDPAFLLTTDLLRPAAALLQAYFDRWQIEVNHREIKDTLGIGQAQLRHTNSVPRQPAMLVAGYSALLLAGIHVFGDKRSEAFPALPKWRRKARRPSCLDLVTVLRQEVASVTDSSSCPVGVDWKSLVMAAAA